MIRFLTIGRVLYDKGFSELVKCASTIQNKYYDVEFQWLGGIDKEYPQHVSHEEVMKYHNDGVINYLGFHSDVKSIIQMADCIILPSYHEGMSRVLMEALAMGKPIITTDIPGCKEMVKEGLNGFLCKRADSESLTNVVEKFIMLSTEERNKMSECSRDYAEKRFDIKKVISIYDKIVSEVCGQTV